MIIKIKPQSGSGTVLTKFSRQKKSPLASGQVSEANDCRRMGAAVHRMERAVRTAVWAGSRIIPVKAAGPRVLPRRQPKKRPVWPRDPTAK